MEFVEWRAECRGVLVYGVGIGHIARVAGVASGSSARVTRCLSVVTTFEESPVMCGGVGGA
eukprot:15447155-Alexandrium_andersonii.AAC.1